MDINVHRHFCTEDIQMDNKPMKRCLMSSAIRGMKSKITVRNHFGLPCWSSGYESP